MLSKIIQYSIKNKLLVLLFTFIVVAFGLYSLSQISIGAVPDITNNQVQVITTSQNLSTQDIEQFITYPVELEMANLPGVKEMRSVSKFGLSVVTIVFEDEMGTYVPRQLIAEKIKSASEKIPSGFGTPFMGPITTGLGEIYQYVLDTKAGYEDRYSVMELRSIQDWIVKRQLSGIPGVVEVNTWGGYLKQYEVAINPSKLNAMQISTAAIVTALEQNNGVSGGAYIEKAKKSYFIRGEGLVGSLEDIRNIVIENRKGNPIYVKDVAEVSYGSANRYGAITGNGKGEKVLGQVMMLKDANSKEVINAVKERVAYISKSLPEGVYINGFLDRSELIEKTTYTITENLILGCLIVIFVVVILLGNMRSGLVVASLIPLSLLFALSLMYLFGVDANLMSLGAIDFGIIIDGAVIIVEYIAFQMSQKSNLFSGLNKVERQQLQDEITSQSSNKMMHSAIFGQFIILIVFIPILSLQGVEGSMFKPMALVFSFALLGAMIFCFTFIPVAASLFLKPKAVSNRNISKRIMSRVEALYDPAIRWALRSKKLVLASSLGLLLLAVLLFSRMGAEFVPTLDEGDFVIQPILQTGTSLSETIAICTKIEKILLDKFPEVEQVITRIGAAEVPTDPMSMEESDVMIRLKEKSSWTSATNKDELANRFKEELSVLGIDMEFTQPIEMRFNELITGVRADIAIKLFGEDLDLLNSKAQEIGQLIEHVEGAADIAVEKTVGLPQMKVSYDRKKMARYGVNVADVNDLLSLAYAGKTVGSVFEGERRFDLVIRLNESHRQDLENLRKLYIDHPDGHKIPLRELASISYEKGAAKISRDDSHRRVVVGVNVRDRDLQSVVEDIQQVLDKDLELPAGYLLEYGGQFENLQSAKNRLLIAVPIALLLIFIFLYFAFKSIRDAVLIYSAIPLAAVGGVMLLLLRDMPFSISAGVGFIALFGIAVLNGIVLIEHFKSLKETESLNGDELIVQGAKDRLRAVLLTASAAALGFLPMAISTNAGAEVQRPLATVVIGGLITATLLTLIVLPVLYSLFGFASKSRLKPKASLAILVFGIGLIPSLQAQENKSYTLEDLELMTFKNNAFLSAQSLQVEVSKSLINSSLGFDKTGLYYAYDENNLAYNNQALKIWGIQQDFRFPTAYSAQRKLQKANFSIDSKTLEIRKLQVKRALHASFQELLFAKEKANLYSYLDSLYGNFGKASLRRYELGGSNYLEKLTAESKMQAAALAKEQAEQDIAKAMNNLLGIVQAEETILVSAVEMEKVELELKSLEASSMLDLYDSKVKRSDMEAKVEKQSLLPDLSLEYFRGNNAGISSPLYGYQLGLKIPLFFTGQASKIKAARISSDRIREEARQYSIELKTEYQRLLAELGKYQAALNYYEESGNLLAGEIIETAKTSYESGDIDFFRYIQSLETATEIRLNYLKNLHQYNQTAIKINHLSL